ncbi:AMP-binding protein, partial [bacterium]|nr:AMP-binding protein [bacterium]
IIKDACVPFSICLEGKGGAIAGEEVAKIDFGKYSVVLKKTPEKLITKKPFFPEDLSKVAVCIYTSGTTGHPKGALLTDEQLLANARMCHKGLDARTEGEVMVTVLPLFHAYAGTACLLMTLSCHSTMLIIENFQPLKVLEEMQKHNATIFLGVPAMYAVLANVEAPPKIPTWRICVSGGAPLPAVVGENFLSKYGLTIAEGDGPTECGPATAFNPVHGPVKVGTIGFPLEGVSMKIVGNDNQELPQGEIGEIIVKSPSNFLAYLNQPEETAKTLVDGWVYTGDLGFVDQDGYFAIVDRKKDMLLVGGLNVYPREIEEYLMRHPAVRECSVIGRNDDLRGEVPVAFVALKEGQTLTELEMRQFLRDKLAAYKIPKELVILDALPRNPTGKIYKLALRAGYQDGTYK